MNFSFLTRRRHNFRAVPTTQPPTVSVHPGCNDRVAPISRHDFCWVIGCGCVVSAVPLRHTKEASGAPRSGAAPRLHSARYSPFGIGPRHKNMNEPESPAVNSCSVDLICAPRSAHLDFIFNIRQKMVRARSLAPFPWAQCDNQGKYFAVDFSARCGLEYIAFSQQVGDKGCSVGFYIRVSLTAHV